MGVYETYIHTWKHYQKSYGDSTCLFYMVGKFYELYDLVDPDTGEGQTNVKQAVDILNIALTVKEKEGPKGETCITAGFPEYTLQKYAGIMTKEGWTVVVCDQTKDAKGSVTGRPVARIFSPGTHIETAGADACYLGGLWLQEEDGAPQYAAAVLDMTTGHVVSYESKCMGNKDIWSADEVVHFFQVHAPRELVVWWRGARIALPDEAVLRRRCGLQKCVLHREVATPEQQGALEKDFVRQNLLEQYFSKKLCLLPVMEQLHLRHKALTERVLICLLRFAEEHLPSAIQNLSEHHLWNPDHSVYLGNNTLSQLNMISFQQGEQSVLSLFSKSYTSLGKRALRERLLSPSSQAEEIQKRLDEVEFAHQLPMETWKSVEGCLRQIHDIARIHRKISMVTVAAADILALDQSYGNIQYIMDLLKDSPLEISQENQDEFLSYKTLFYKCFDIEKAKQSIKQEDIYFLPESKAPKTCALEQKIKDQKIKLEEAMEKIRVWANLPERAFTLEIQESGTYTLTGTKTTLSIVKRKLQQDPPYPDISIHEKKTSRGTLEFSYINQCNAIIFQLRNQLQVALKDELTDICREVQHPCWLTLETWVGFVDSSFTIARLAKERGYTKPILKIQESAGLKAIGLRHPLLETIQTKIEYVKHNVSLGMGEDQGWLLYGMNASGKSSLMKAIGLSILLAQAGSYVPATSFTFSPFHSILTRILNQDNLWAGLSSFAVEVSELRDIFQKADSTSLVLGDELCSGTESISATSLVASGIQYLHKKNSRFVFATHLHGLLSISDIAELPNLGIWHLQVHYNAAKDTLIYDRTLHRGPGGTLYGLEVARAMHLPYEIVDQAFKFRHALLGEKAVEEADASSYNSLVIRKECQICHHTMTRDLEVHHIRPQAEASQKHFDDGSHMNDLRNLIVVCQTCHDKHHNGEIEIKPVKQTSVGPQLEVIEIPQQEKKEVAKKSKSKWSAEQQQIIETSLRKFPHLYLSRIRYDLKKDHEIDISEAALGKIRNNLS